MVEHVTPPSLRGSIAGWLSLSAVQARPPSFAFEPCACVLIGMDHRQRLSVGAGDRETLALPPAWQSEERPMSELFSEETQNLLEAADRAIARSQELAEQRRHMVVQCEQKRQQRELREPVACKGHSLA